MSVITLKTLTNTPEAGDILPDGATVIDAVLTSSEAHEEGTYYYGFVLAQWGKEFVTWRLGIKPDGEIVTSDGRYMRSIYDALKNYIYRKDRT